MAQGNKQEKVPVIYRMLNGVEWVGNKMPDPITIFFILCLVIIALSAILARAGFTAVHPRDGSTITIINLLEKGNLQAYFSSIVMNFQNFPPLALVLVVMIGVGVAEKTGMMEAALKRTIVGVPKKLITTLVIFVGILANAAGDAGFVVLPPLAAVVFISVGRHPLIGAFAAFGGVAAGFAANIMVNLSDVLAAGFTIPAAQLIEPSYEATAAMNFYFLLVSTVFLTATGVFVTEYIIAPRFENMSFDRAGADTSVTELTAVQRKGLFRAGIAFLVCAAVLVLLCIGKGAFMADPDSGSILGVNAPLMKGIIPVVTVLFLVPGLIYGCTAGTIKRDRDAIVMMGQSMSAMGPYIVLAFMASQFLALFSKSNLGVMLAIKGAEALRNAGISGMGLIFCFIILSAFINLFIGSASAKWAIMAPVFVPMLLLLGFDPALTQMAYRIGDSVTNPVSPLFPYFPILLGYMNMYKKDAGMGTIIANMLPYSVCFFIAWTILLFVFVFFGIPLGPR